MVQASMAASMAYGWPADFYGPGCDGWSRTGNNGAGREWSVTATATFDGSKAGDTAWYDAWAGHATGGHAWHPWHADGYTWRYGRPCIITPQLFARPPMLGLPGQQVVLAGGGQMVMGQHLQAPQLQMQVQQSPFGPVLGAVPRFR